MFVQENGSNYLKVKATHFIIFLLISLFAISAYTYYSINNDEYNYFKLEKMFNIVENHYKGEISRDELYQNAIKGVVGNLDKYSYAVVQNKNKKYYSSQNSIVPDNSYVGIGVIFNQNEKGLLIDDIYKDSDFNNKANVGDIVTKIGDVAYNGNFNDFILLFKGQEGEKKKVEIINKDNEIKEIVVSIKKIIKDQVIVKTIDDILYVKVREFSPDLNEEFMTMIEEETEEDFEKYKGVVLDLADNPGGLFSEGINLSDLIIDVDDKLAVLASYKDERDYSEYYLQRGDFLENLPVVLIVDKNSASSSEIFAGVFQSFNRGLVVGQKTYGKGVGQTVFDFNDEIEVALTTFEFLIGEDKKSINKKGITPDIIIEEDYKENREIYINKAIDILNNQKL